MSRSRALLAAVAALTAVSSPLPPRTPIRPEVCFAPGTSRDYAASIWQAQQMVEAFQIHPTFGKWTVTATNGSVPVRGTPLTLTWTVVPDGTPVAAMGGIAGESAAASNLQAFLNGIYGSSATWLPIIQQVFDTEWSAVTGVTYQYVAYDDMSSLSNGGVFPYNPGVIGTRADIRIGGHSIDGPFNVLAYNFFPDVGDMVIDTADTYYSGPGGGTANGNLGFRNILAHEHGHGLGFRHVCPLSPANPSTQGKLMEPFLATSFDGPQLDDKSAAWRQYGDNGENDDTSGTAINLGTFNTGSPAAITQVALDGSTDLDFFRFTVPAGRSASAVLSPVGTAYLQGPQTADCDNDGDGGAGAPTSYNPSTQNDLVLQLLSTDGTTVLASANAGGAGASETIPVTALPVAGNFFFRVSGGATDAVQAYQLAITLGDVVRTISIGDVTLSEGNAGGTTFTFNVTLSGPATAITTVNWATAPNTATTPSDFATNSGTVMFLVGESSKPVNVTVNGDTAYENNEGFFVNLSGAVNATIADSQGLGTITNDDAMPTLAIGDVTMLEGNAGSQVYAFTVSLSPASGLDVTVDWATFSVTATAGSDFVGTGGSLLFTPGQTAKVVNVTVNGDTLYEATEIFSVNLSNAVGATYADFQGVGTLTNDDTQPSLSINDVTLAEGGTGSTTNFSFTVTLSPASGLPTTVNYATASVTATAGSDYLFASGMLTFAPGETTKPIVVTVNGDGMLEPNETFNVGLSGATNATISDATGVGTINNDDVAPARVFVSVAGADTNDCSNIATPCRTLNAAILQVAVDGEVIVIDSGSYAGATITKGVKIDAASGVVAFSAQTVTVNAPGGKVVVRGLTLKAGTPGTGTGLMIQAADAVFVENTVIDGWATGIQQGAPEAFIKDSIVRNNNTGFYSIAGKTTIDGSRFTNNNTGFFNDIGTVAVRGSTISGNLTGILNDNPSVMTVEKCQIANNTTTGVLSSGDFRLSRSVVSGNGTGLQHTGGTLSVYGNNVVRGNTTNTSGTITPVPLQ